MDKSVYVVCSTCGTKVKVRWTRLHDTEARIDFYCPSCCKLVNSQCGTRRTMRPIYNKLKLVYQEWER